MSSDLEKTADKAYETFVDIMSGGIFGGREWPEFFSQLAEELDFIWPYPPMVGHYTGTAGRQKFEEIFSGLGTPENRFPETTPMSRAVGTDRVVYEDYSKGVVGGEPYEGRHCIHIIVNDGKVVGFHEYHAPVA